jgi:acyl-CoA reductase-like NAD-dependent aldehyde dehydrogenase
VSHSDIDAVSFTGSAAVGEQIASLAGMKRLVLELGGNSPNIVHQDANLARAVPLLASAGFSNAGQSCNSVQRIFVHHSLHDELLEGLVEAAGRMVVGDPLDDATDIGTLVDEAAAIRVEGMIQAARDEGAQIITGGERSGPQMTPTILTAVEPEMEISSEEVFGPVVVLMPYSDIEEAITKANATPYGLQAAVFTESLGVAHKAIRELRFGGVMVNRPSKFRLDHLPFGGVKRSGIGRESALYSLLEFTATKLAVIDASG